MSPELDNFSSMNASTTNIDTTSNDANTLENFHLTVNITALIFGHIDLIACSLVIYSAYVRWRTSSLAISSRVPLYLSISDVLQCPAKYWCLTSATTDNPLNTLIIGVIVTFAITFITTCYSYIKTLSMIFNVDREEISTSMDRVNRRNKLERQTTLKILIYISIYIKWIPLMLYGICTMSGYDEALWMHIFAITGFHLGGIYNCILYLMNEGIRRSNKDLTLCALENRSFNQSDYQPPQQSKSQDPESINIID
ncbi:11068_t:CDS:2 [Funneliformis geosporum]|nr:11068_t:CDS:2 [Funneliformis geosporum]